MFFCCIIILFLYILFIVCVDLEVGYLGGFVFYVNLNFFIFILKIVKNMNEIFFLKNLNYNWIFFFWEFFFLDLCMYCINLICCKFIYVIFDVFSINFFSDYNNYNIEINYIKSDDVISYLCFFVVCSIV